MNYDRWHSDNLQQLLVLQQEEYQRRGLEHELYAEDDAAFFSTWLCHRLIILSLIPIECRKSGTKVLDIGGGKGRISTLLSDLELRCANIDCLYLEADTLNVMGNPLIPLLRAYNEEKGVEIVARDAYEDGISFSDGSFDLVIFSEVIEHLPNSPKPILSDIHRVLCKGGWMILTTPNLVSFKRRVTTLLGRSTRNPIESFYNMEGYPVGSVYRGHNREYTLQEVEYMLAQENFTIEDSQMVDFSSPQTLSKLFREIINEMVADWRFRQLRIKGMLSRLGDFLFKRISSGMKDYIVILARK